MVASVENRVRRTMQDKIAALRSVDMAFSIPPGGKTLFPNFLPYATQLLKIAGEGSSFSLMSIVYPEERKVRRQEPWGHPIPT